MPLTETVDHNFPNMDIDEFEKSLVIGLGRAIVFLRGGNATAYRPVILQACIHNWAFDNQLEGNRAEFMHDVISLTNEIGFYRDEILAALRVSGDDDDADQLFDLARLFAQEGDSDARRAIYEKFLENCAAADDTGATAIIELDKAEGLIFVADTMGDNLRPDTENWVDYLLGAAKEAGVSDPLQILIAAVPEHDGIRSFLARVDDNRAAREAKLSRLRDPGLITYDEIKQSIVDTAPTELPTTPRGWGRHASEADLQRAALDLFQQSQPKRIRAYLRIFSQRRFPLDPSRLIELAANPDRSVAMAALMALANIRHPDVRSLAMGLIATDGEMAGRAVDLLTMNYEPGDHALIEGLATQPLSAEAYHLFGFSTLDFYAAHPQAASEERVMLLLYENGPCTFCREKAIDRLVALKRLPQWMADAGRYDASPDIRAKMAAYHLVS
jgi:hypothetical protein